MDEDGYAKFLPRFKSAFGVRSGERAERPADGPHVAFDILRHSWSPVEDGFDPEILAKAKVLLGLAEALEGNDPLFDDIQVYVRQLEDRRDEVLLGAMARPSRRPPPTASAAAAELMRDFVGREELDTWAEKFEKLEAVLDPHELEDDGLYEEDGGSSGESDEDELSEEEAARLLELQWAQSFPGEKWLGTKDALERWDSLLDEQRERKEPFERLSLTGCQLPALSRDCMKLPYGHSMSRLLETLARAGLPETAEGVLAFAKKFETHFVTLRERISAQKGQLERVWGDGELDLTSMEICYEPLGADFHGSPPPTKLDITVKGQTKSFVHKQRPSQVDCAVTELFADINELLGKPLLPTYRQVTLMDGSLLSEYVDGVEPKGFDPNLGIGYCLPAFAEQHPGADPEKLADSVLKLEAIAKLIGLSDLHCENLRIVGNEVYLIDLESFPIGPPTETGLYGFQEPKPTSVATLCSDELGQQKIQARVGVFRRLLQSLERRWVPVPTADLTEAVATEDSRKLYQLIAGACESAGVTLDTKSLQSYLSTCMEHKAIPLFTVCEGEVLCSEVGSFAKQKVGEVV